ncbi:MAG: FKBP-type peptidyl-prolyl cis-trans isomerase [Spirosomataceae bacterium]
MFKKLTIVTLFSLVCWACDQNKINVTDTGLKYRFYEHDDKGRKAKLGEILTVHLELKATSPKDTVLRSTYKENAPLKVVLQPSAFKGSFEEGLAMLAKGDSATFFIPADSLFGKAMQPLPPYVAKGSDLAFTVKVLSIQNREEFEKDMTKQREVQKGIDAKLLADFLAKNNIKNAQSSPSGLYYVITQEGSGASPAKGDSVTVRYTGKLLNGKVFDSNVAEGIKFPVGVGWVIPGWDEGLMKLKKGAKATLYIPSALAYGSEGASGAIPPNAALVFDVELVDFTKKK